MNEPIKPSRQWQRWTLLVLAVLATAVALFYLEEDWRGKRAWEQGKAEMETKGLVLDWDKFMPKPVPDDQNFYMASTNILRRFKKAQTDSEIALALSNISNKWLRIEFDFPAFVNTRTNPLLVAELFLSSPGDAPGHTAQNPVSLKLGEPNTPGQLQAIIQKTLGRSVLGAAGFKFSEQPLRNLTSARIVLTAEAAPTVTELAKWVPENLCSNLGSLHVEATDDHQIYHVLLTDAHVTTAAEYLKWSEQFEPALNEVREALKRPYAILPGDYSVPYQIPIPNFVVMRSLVQLLAQRAQCHLLLHDPKEALHDLTLVHDVCRILRKPPGSGPETLVEAMINVAVYGLYTSALADGFRLGEWQEPQLAALQNQLQTIDLSPWVVEAFRAELASGVRTLGTTPADKIAFIINPNEEQSVWHRMRDPFYLYLRFAPKGWHEENKANLVRLQSTALDGFNSADHTISPAAVDHDELANEQVLAQNSPFVFLCKIFVPNIGKATLATAFNQNLVNEAQIACALERYRLAKGEYPATLDALVPAYSEKLPPDIIGGQPMHYRRTEDGKFVLYSVGWNEKDDGGQSGQDAKGAEDRLRGDWVWPVF